MLFLAPPAVEADGHDKKPKDKDKVEITDVLTPEEAAKLREQLKALAIAFGATAEPTPVPQQQAGKSMADVADRALDLLTGVTSQLSKLIEKIAPEVWRIMLRQQYANAVGLVAVPSGLLIVSNIALYGGCWHKVEPSQRGNKRKAY